MSVSENAADIPVAEKTTNQLEIIVPSCWTLVSIRYEILQLMVLEIPLQNVLSVESNSGSVKVTS